ncbi:MAG: DUF3536 domain-containing protein [Deltaproteobacteria bacterium]|nr:DUF3536 domain-containing protein [Deltaproteobacteria bacterium]MBW2070641.1 DUF3536 domain-containing protein [Deltaproteobacteria bacterium]
MERYICIHGHFYQPPRENPWLEAIELQDSAHPYHDWNEKITAECYAPNATSRILDDRNRIVHLVNNYQKISFDFGPTLLSWLENHAPEVYAAILQADQESQLAFAGHGSALAQAYNHMIMPLANSRDKYTQVVWGIRDFEQRFGRRPEGMWLPETAVDLESLEILAAHDIHFTILAPRQAHRIRPLGSKEWLDVSGGKIDPSRAYTLKLPSGKNLALFFYNGPIARAVAFEGLLNRGETFAQRLVGGFTAKQDYPQMVHIATDGETYGHHHPFGDMALAYAVHYIESNSLARLTNYGEYLERHPPRHEVEIFENTSWSCIHGVERWRSDCGCHLGAHPDWNQTWRAPLRQAMDWLRDNLAPVYEDYCSNFVYDPWKARNDYIQVVLDRSDASLERFLQQQARNELNSDNTVTLCKLLELQRYAMLMYTSCGWYFDELSGIETIQILQYAGRVLQLAKELFPRFDESPFLAILEQAESNKSTEGNGRHIYEQNVAPAVLDLERVAAHYGMSSLFQAYEQEARIYCFQARQEDYRTAEAGRAKVALGRITLSSTITRESNCFCFGVFHWGDHNLLCGVRQCQPPEIFAGSVEELMKVFSSADFPGTIQLLESHFGQPMYTLKDLFRDEQRKILDTVLAATLVDVEAMYRQVYEYNAPLFRFLHDLGSPLPLPLSVAAEVVLNLSLQQAFQEEQLEAIHIEKLLKEAYMSGVSLNTTVLELTFRKKLEHLAKELLTDSSQEELLHALDSALHIMESLPFAVNLRQVQNYCYHILHRDYPALQHRAAQGDADAARWVQQFASICDRLSILVPE